MIAANVRVIDKAGHRGEQRCDDSEEHCVKGTAQQTWHFRKSQANEIEQKTQNQKPDRKMNQHRMNRMPQRFAFEKIFQHGFSYSGGRLAPLAAASLRHFFFDIRATLMPYS